MTIKDAALTILLSATTCVIVNWVMKSPSSIAAAVVDRDVDELTVDRLIVRNELIVSDTGEPWEPGFERHQIPRGIYARSVGTGFNGPSGAAGLWVRGRLIKTEIDDPFDDRFHAINRDGSPFRAPGHISWNVWLGDAWRQMTNIQGEALELSEVPADEWSGGNHPGRLRIQSFRPHHDEPLTDVLIGQGMMSVGGGGYGGGGLPYPTEVLQLWGGQLSEASVQTPSAPKLVFDDGSGPHTYALIAVGPQGNRSAISEALSTNGLASLEWDSAIGADAYIIVRDGEELTGVVRAEGSNKHWTDNKP